VLLACLRFGGLRDRFAHQLHELTFAELAHRGGFMCEPAPREVLGESFRCRIVCRALHGDAPSNYDPAADMARRLGRLWGSFIKSNLSAAKFAARQVHAVRRVHSGRVLLTLADADSEGE
jgi:hypothetical protein